MPVQYYYGQAPSGEHCAQVGSDDYESQGLKEATAFVDLIYRFLESKGHTRESLPESLRFSVSRQNHDFGMYYEVVAKFDNDDPREEECNDIALLVDWECPTEWDDQAKTWLKENGYEVVFEHSWSPDDLW